MGRIVRSKYRLEITDSAGTHKLLWRGRSPGARLGDHILAYAKSLERGGSNEHISKNLGYIPYPSSARIIEQDTGRTVAQWKAGMFQVYEGHEAGESAGKLPSENPSTSTERKVRSAAADRFGRGKADPFFEHGHWWVKVYEEDPDGYRDYVERIFSVVDTNRGFDFEEVS